MHKMKSYAQRINEFDSLRPSDMVVCELEEFEQTQDLVDGQFVRSRKIVKRHPAEKFKGFKVSDFTIASLQASGADSMLQKVSTLSGNTFRILDSIPDPALVNSAPAAPAAPASTDKPVTQDF